MISRTGDMLHTRVDGAHLVEPVYGEGRHAMTMVLPDEGASLAALPASLDRSLWSRWTGAPAFRPVSLSLPRCTVQTGTTLKPSLSTLAMASAFGPAQADLHGVRRKGGLYWVTCATRPMSR